MLFAYIFGVTSMYPDKQMYSCNGTSTEHYPNIFIGLLYLFIGVFAQLVYIPCIIVMSRPPLFQMTCFKIMVYMGFVDVSCLFICADLAGIWQLTGQTFCHSPAFAYVTGNVSMGLWSATCFCCVFLAFNRTWDLCLPHKEYIFEGRFMYLWMMLPTMYFFFFTFFERPLLYDPISSTFLFDPKTNYSHYANTSLYSNLPHTVNNSIVIVSLLAFYPLICISLAFRVYKNRTSRISSMTKQIIAQSMVICGCHILGCFLYVYAQYFSLPSVFTVITNLAWIGNHGLPGIVYMSLNKTIRFRVLALVGLRKQKKTSMRKATISLPSIHRNDIIAATHLIFVSNTSDKMLFAYIFRITSFYPNPRMYDCTGTTNEYYPNILIGILYLIMGIFAQSIYIPCLIVMTRPPLVQIACYKIMIYMGIVDVSCLFICADLAGIWQLIGQTFCHSPSFAYFTGNVAMGLWTTTCFCCVFLAFRRTWDICFPGKGKIFEGRLIYLWMTLPTAYFIFFTFFERPLIYDPRTFTFLFDPKTNYSSYLNPAIYSNVPHSVNNAIVIVSLLSFYPLICYSLVIRVHIGSDTQLSSVTNQIIVQLMVISACHVLGCFLYVYTQYFKVSSVFTLISNLAWIGNHGLPGVVYLVLNKTIRSRVLVLVGFRSKGRKPGFKMVTGL